MTDLTSKFAEHDPVEEDPDEIIDWQNPPEWMFEDDSEADEDEIMQDVEEDGEVESENESENEVAQEAESCTSSEEGEESDEAEVADDDEDAIHQERESSFLQNDLGAQDVKNYYPDHDTQIDELSALGVLGRKYKESVSEWLVELEAKAIREAKARGEDLAVMDKITEELDKLDAVAAAKASETK